MSQRVHNKRLDIFYVSICWPRYFVLLDIFYLDIFATRYFVRSIFCTLDIFNLDIFNLDISPSIFLTEADFIASTIAAAQS